MAAMLDMSIFQKALARKDFLILATGLAIAASTPLLFVGCGSRSTEGSDSRSAEGDKTTAGAAEQEAHYELQTATLLVFDTVVQLSAYCSVELMEAAQRRCVFFEETFSRTIEGSDVWRINEASGQPVEVEYETAEIVRLAKEYSEISEGLFDITIGSVSCLWDFVVGIKPDDHTLAEAVSHVDYTALHVEGTTVTLNDPLAKIDLGGIAKGYIADELVRLFKDGGCESALINLGGNVVTLGTKPDGSAWKVGVQDPNGKKDEIIATVEGSDMSYVTSGLYERGFELSGVQYYHILDPTTGFPVLTDLVSTSIECASSTRADATSTILFLLGHTKALAYLETADDMEGLLVDKEGVVILSSGARYTV